jgi:hypothetical protein
VDMSVKEGGGGFVLITSVLLNVVSTS